MIARVAICRCETSFRPATPDGKPVEAPDAATVPAVRLTHGVCKRT